jgi:Sulfotransferase domain
MRIACVTTCKGRLHHLQQTLSHNIRDRGLNGVVFVLLDYSDRDDLGDYIQAEHKADIDAGTLVYYRFDDAERFHMAHAKNMAHRCAIGEGADILVTLDADNLNGPGFIDYVTGRFAADPELSFLCPDFKTLPPPGQRFNKANPVRLGRGFAGRLAIRWGDFLKAGGYNEVYDTWRGEDIDLIARLGRLSLKKGAIEPIFLNAIAHTSKLRFCEYPDAEKFESEDVYAATEKASDTVVNNGRLGCGAVYRNFDRIPFYLAPIPTRIFGIGMQRTGTSSLHAAFQSLGFDAGHWKSAEWAQAIWREMNRWGRSRTLEKDYALSDNPIPLLYEQLDQGYPGSKFVLTVRDEDGWIRSVRKFWTYEGNPRRWTWDADGFSHKVHAITYGIVTFDEAVFRARYRKHNADAEAYFRGRSDFLKLDISDPTAMDKLCRFLGQPVIGQSFPHENRSNPDGASHP